MYPEIIRIGNFVISSYGLMVAIAFFTGTFIAELEWRRKGLNKEDFNWIFILVLIGAVIGAKLLYIFENVPLSQFISEPFTHLFSRGGFTYYGGFILSALLILFYARYKKMNILKTGDAIGPPLTLGYSIARIGCFLVGDDYGKPSGLFWAMPFPKGTPPTTAGSLSRNFGIEFPPDVPENAIIKVHPTQIYEVIFMFIFFLILWKTRKKLEKNEGVLFAIYIIVQGLERFLVEFLRMTTPSFIPGISVAQLIAFVFILIGGSILWMRLKKN